MGKKFFIFIALLCLVGCGFKLRGDHTRASLAGIQLNLGVNQVDENFVKRLKVAFRDNLVAQDGSVLHLELLELRYDRRVLTIDNLGRVSEYELIQTLRYQLFKGNAEQTSEYVIRTQRLMAFDRGQLLVKEREETFLEQEMTNDLIRQLRNHVRHFG